MSDEVFVVRALRLRPGLKWSGPFRFMPSPLTRLGKFPGDRSEGCAPLALGYRSAAPLGRWLVIQPLEHMTETIFQKPSGEEGGEGASY